MKTRMLMYAIAGSVLVAGLATMAVGTPVRVIDGDTIDVRDTRYRLWGIQAPEIDDVCGPAARDHLAFLLAADEPLTCERQQAALSYGRVVAQCSIGPVDLGQAMVRAGMASDWANYSGGHYGGDEAWARINELGIWNPEGCSR